MTKTVLIVPDGELAEYLMKGGICWPAEGLEIDAEELERCKKWALKLHPQYSEQQILNWACYQILAKPRMSGETKAHLGDKATAELSKWVSMMESQSRAFHFMRAKLEGFIDGIEKATNEQTQKLLADGFRFLSQEQRILAAQLRNCLCKHWEQENERRADELTERRTKELKAGETANRQLLLIWLWRIAMLGSLAVVAWRI